MTTEEFKRLGRVGRKSQPFRDLEKRGITEENYHLHLEEMSDQEISAMLDLTEGKSVMEEQRKAQPSLTDRRLAEILRDF